MDFFLWFISTAQAQISGSGFDGIIPTSQNTGDLAWRIRNGEVTLNDIPLVIVALIDLLTKIAGTLAVIMIIVAGFQMILSEIADTKEKAKTTLTWAVLGLVVTFLAWVIVNVVQTQLTS